MLAFVISARRGLPAGLAWSAAASSSSATGSGPGATGVLQSALGNLPELFICIFALQAGLVDVVRAALVGSILANLLLVLGLAFLVGGLRHGTQQLGSERARTIVVLMLLSVTAMAIPSIAHELHAPAAEHEVTFSRHRLGRAARAVRACRCRSRCAGDQDAAPRAGSRQDAPVAAAGWRSAMLAAAGVLRGVRLRLVRRGARAGRWTPWTSREAFAGLVIVAIAGNAVENVVGVQLAAAGQSEYAFSIVLNSPLQIALVLAPVLVHRQPGLRARVADPGVQPAARRRAGAGHPAGGAHRHRRRVDLARGSRAGRALRDHRDLILVGLRFGSFGTGGSPGPRLDCPRSTSSRSPGSPRPSARPGLWTGSTSRSPAARCTVSSDPTAPASPRLSGSCSACSARTPARSGCSAATRGARPLRCTGGSPTCPGDVNLWPNLTGGEVIDLLGRLRGGLDEDAATRARSSGSSSTRPRRAAAYSKGNRQKVALVAALRSDVELLVLDEPTPGLDPLMESVFQECVDEFRDSGGHRAAVEPHPRRGRAALRPGQHHPGRPVRRDRHARRPAPPDPHVGRSPSWSGRPRAGRTCDGVHDLVVEGNRAMFEVDTGPARRGARALRGGSASAP